MKYTINVTQEDIDNGKPTVPAYCPVALAVKRATGYDNVNAGPQFINILDYKFPVFKLLHKTKTARARTPEIATQFMTSFDTSRLVPELSKILELDVKPFSFEIEVEEWR